MQTEEEQIEAIKSWWQDNGVAVILGIVVGLGGLIGWQSWQKNMNLQAEQASIIYMDVLVSMENKAGEGVEKAADNLVSNFPESPYTTLGAFAAAKSAILLRDDMHAEAERLNWIIDNSKQLEFVQLAKLRLARNYILNDKIDDAEKLIESETFPASYAARVAELRGEILSAKGQYADALVAYDKAINSDIPVQNRQMIQIKRDAIASKPGATKAAVLPDIELKAAEKPSEPSDA